jgi:endonuclease-3
MPDFRKLIARLEKHYGAPSLPPARGAFELVIWENACYLLPDERRAQVFQGLSEQVGMSAEAIARAPRAVLLPLATLGGMRPETRVFRWQEIARVTLEQFAGDLEQILAWPYARAKKALKLFPSIGDPGAEKILLFCGAAEGLPLESNGLRVLTRIGYGRIHLKNYGAMYKSAQEAIAPELPKSAAALTRAHLLLREHGKTICKDKTPACYDCPVESLCAFRQSRLFDSSSKNSWKTGL